MPAPISETTQEEIATFLTNHGLPSDSRLEIASHREGRVVAHLHHSGWDYTIKHFAETDALKEQFYREHCFYRLLKSLQTGATPVLLESSDQSLLLSRIAGRKLRESEIDRRAIQQAIGFLVALNQAPSPLARACPMAAGACFSIREHLNPIASQIAQIQHAQKDVNPQTESFIRDEMSPLWQQILGDILSQFQTAGISMDRELIEDERMLSPGEFGFHNALITGEREICFVDFDQAGWDDPARLLCNFFTIGNHFPKQEHWDEIIEGLSHLDNLDAQFAIRARILLPAYQILRATLSLLECLQKSGKSHSKIEMIHATNQSRRWLRKASQAF